MSGDQIYPVILCGGAGTRLWPLSRKSFPKQFARLTGETTLLQHCARRLQGEPFAETTLVTADPFRFIVEEQLAEVGVQADAILIEPRPANTAPAILAAALHVAETDPHGLMLIAPSDHLIPDHERFRETICTAQSAAANGRIITFGVTPTRPETGYGYLQVQWDTRRAGVLPLARFIEKPDAKTAHQLIAGQDVFWNAGLFLFAASTLIAAFEDHAPAILDHVRQAVQDGRRSAKIRHLAATPWARIKGQSIDYAIMEKATNIDVVPYQGTWSDLGDWNAVWRELEDDGLAQQGLTTALDCSNTLLRSEVTGQAIVGIGLEDIVAVAMPDAVLVSHKDRAQDVKKAVIQLKADAIPQAETYPTDHRPWGWFESIATGDRFQVKRIRVKPGAALSLQSHHHRAEHWIVVAGTAKVTVGNEVRLVAENESIYIPLGAKHRLENPGKLPITLIEVQTGAYLGEDDIIRHEDIYARP